MHWEVEQKFSVNERAAAEQCLLKSGFVLSNEVNQADHYFNHPARDFARTDEALRLRQEGERNFITYKGPKIDAVTKTRRELELPLAEGTAMALQYRTLLEALGFRFVATVRKHRRFGETAWEGLQFEVTLDEVEGLGPFVEIETVADDASLDAARAKLGSLAQHLGLTQVERRSYLELLMAVPSTERQQTTA